MLSLSMNDENRKKYQDLAEQYGRHIQFIDVNPVIAFLQENGVPAYGGSLATYVKLFSVSLIENAIGKQLENIVYIDADMIINGSLDELVSENYGEAPCAMTLDRTCNYYKKGIGMQEDDIYYNAGLIVFNVPKWKEQKCEEAIRNHITGVRASYPFCDQDIINVVLSKKTKTLDIRFNYNTDIMLYNDISWYCDIFDVPDNYYSIKQIKEASEDIRVIHCFESIAARPWINNSTFPNPQKELWDSYLKISPWSDYVAKTKEFPMYIKLQTIGYRFLPKKLYAFLCVKFLHKRMKARLYS